MKIISEYGVLVIVLLIYALFERRFKKKLSNERSIKIVMILSAIGVVICLALENSFHLEVFFCTLLVHSLFEIKRLKRQGELEK